MLSEAFLHRLDTLRPAMRSRARGGSGGKLFGAVTGKEIAEAAAAQFGAALTKQQVVSDPIKTFGAYTVKAKLGYEISGNINLLVVEE